jgi:hypothetical protein
VSGYAVVTYDLDGSGKAQNLQVVESRPANVSMLFPSRRYGVHSSTRAF